MDGDVGKIVEGSDHLLSIFILCDVVGMANFDASDEFLDFTLFNECSVTVILPVVPIFLFHWATEPFTPSLLDIAALEGMLGTCGSHGLIGDWNCNVHN